MSREIEERITSIIAAYFTLPRSEYAEMITEIRNKGGFSPAEVRMLKDRLLFVHSDTIIRQAGLSETGKMHASVP